jgi:cobalt/nickel transport system permease protein
MRRNLRFFVLAGIFVALGLALFVSPLASSSPDGLNRVAADKGFEGASEGHPLSDGPIANYSVRGVDNARLSKGLSGVIGVLITFGVGLALFGLLRTVRARE